MPGGQPQEWIDGNDRALGSLSADVLFGEKWVCLLRGRKIRG
jgi:hypothetical protein